MTRFVACLLLVSVYSFAASPDNDKNIVVGLSDTTYSKTLGEIREFFVYLPPSYKESEKKYPLIILLDGDVHRWKSFVGVLEALSTDTLSNQIREAIVVAIPNTNRSRDLTPTLLKEWKFEGRILDTFSATGGASKFVTFLQKELLPYVERTYNVSCQRMLVGESFGGLFAGYVLLHEPSLFTDYLLIDPTSLWDNNYLNRTLSHTIREEAHNINTYFAFANNSQLGKIGITNLKWGQEFATKIAAKTQTGIKVKQEYFEHESHGTVALMGWYNGLKHLLKNANN